MEQFRKKLKYTLSYSAKILVDMIRDLADHYLSVYPILLIIGAFRRIFRRLKVIWLAKPKGRPPLHENIVELIIDMKRSNSLWGALRISNELKMMGIYVSKRTVQKVLKNAGFVPPKRKFVPPSWNALQQIDSRFWSMDFTCVFDIKGIQTFIFAIIEVPSRKLILINSTTNPSKMWLIQ